MLCDRIPGCPGSVLELGSGAGFLSSYLPDAITSEVFPCRDVQAILDGRQLPFRSSSLRAIVMVDVLHHIPDTRPFLHDASRCLQTSGAILMIEPWVSTWSSLMYRHLHHEPFEPESAEWGFPGAGPLSGANGALPWIVFQRDRAAFENAFPEFAIREVKPMMPFRYLVSGGVSRQQLMPEALFPLWKQVDKWLCRWSDTWPMFALIDVRKR